MWLPPDALHRRPEAAPRPPAVPFERLPEFWYWRPCWRNDADAAHDFALFDQLPRVVRDYLNAAPQHFSAIPCYYALKEGWTVERLLYHLDFKCEQWAAGAPVARRQRRRA